MVDFVKDTSATANKSVPKFERTTPWSADRLNGVFQPLLNSVPEASAASGVLTNSYSSGETTPVFTSKTNTVGSKTVTYYEQAFTHGLNALPKVVRVYFKISSVTQVTPTAQLVGKTFPITWAHNNATTYKYTNNVGVLVLIDTTNITIQTFEQLIRIKDWANTTRNARTGARPEIPLGPSNFKWIVSAWS